MAQYTFSQPIRYYKANDPYYYEVDNIPLRQLEENILHLKQNLETEGYGDTEGGGYLTQNSEIDMTQIKQLRPKLTGSRVVSVNAGKFNARINDAYNISHPLTRLLSQATVGEGGDMAQGDKGEPTIIPPLYEYWSSQERVDVWNSFLSTGQNDAYNMNGLEVAYTFHQSPEGIGTYWNTTTAATMGIPATDEGGGNYPHYSNGNSASSKRWPFQTQDLVTPGSAAATLNYSQGYRPTTLQDIHLAFVKMWRSVFRTAVVDFPQSTIEVPIWNSDDFYYYDGNGDKQLISDASQRIDLLFAYAMPIDVSSTTINDFEANYCAADGSVVPKTITKPALGILRGAGVGIRLDKNTAGTITGVDTVEHCGDPGTPGSKRMLANHNDTFADANEGITTKLGNKIHGSFPSPDDLLNQAANLVLTSADDYNLDVHLIGQTVLPLAYVVVNSNQPVLTADDVIDIRPFLRTTELTYNERSGIATAQPPLSFANPAVGAFQLKDAVRRVYNKIDSEIGGAQSTSLGKPIYMDYIMGGLAYGPEGTMLSMNDLSIHASDPWGSTTVAQVNYNGQSFASYSSNKAYLSDNNQERRREFIDYCYNNRQGDLKRWLQNPNESNNGLNYLNLSSFRNIPIWPEWQLAVDTLNSQEVFNGSHKCSEPTWWMWLEALSEKRPIRYFPGGTFGPGSGNHSPLDNAPKELKGFIQSCMKKCTITLPSWVRDYDILVDYVNSTPYGGVSDPDNTKAVSNLGSGLSVNKGPISADGTAEFTITSSANNMKLFGDDKLVFQGRILDQYGDGSEALFDQQSAIGNALADWLCYTVILPQFKQSEYRTGQETEEIAAWQRYTPKFGAAFYPTVKFTVIGYPMAPYNLNKEYQFAGANSVSKGMIPNNTFQGQHDRFTDNAAPVYEMTHINISDLEY